MSSEVILNSFTGGTSKYKDAGFISNEECINQFQETVVETDTYTNKILRSIEGSTLALTLVNNLSVEYGGCRGLYVAKTSPLSSHEEGGELLYGVFGESLFRIYSDYSYFRLGSVSNNDEPVDFAETGGAPAFLCICSNYQVLSVGLEDEDSLATLEYLPLPIRTGTTDTSIRPTTICNLNYRIICNDYQHDYFYYSNLGKPNGVDNEHAFYVLKTRYKYTKNDGSFVTYDDNQYYAPSEDSYVEDTLESEEQWFGALCFQKAEFASDIITGIRSADDYLAILGTASLQIYVWQDNEYNPFITTTKTTEVGCKYIKSAVNVGGKIVFLASSKTGENAIYSVDASSVTRISKSAPWLENTLSRMSVKSDSFAYSYTKDGHQFYIISFPTENKTYCYDFSEDEWHLRSTRNSKNILSIWYPSFSVRCYGKIYLASYYESKLLYLDENKCTDYNGKMIQRERTTGITINNFNNVIIRSLELICNSGTTPILQTYDSEGKPLSTEGYNPTVMLQISFDGGQTWGTERWSKLGRQGQYDYRVRWNNLGVGRKVAFRVSVTDPCPWIIATAKLTYTKCGK